MKLQTQFTIPNKKLRDLDYFKKVEDLEKTLKKAHQDYPCQEDYLIYCDWLSINRSFIAYKFKIY